MGKSTTASMFADLGVPVWDADAAVHRLYSVGGAAVMVISEICPDAVVDGTVSRAALKDWIAGDATALRQIETVVHPLVAADRAAFIAGQGGAPLVVLDIPLLFETGGADQVDVVVVVSTDHAEQRRRVLARPGMTLALFDTILAKQMPDAEKRTCADVVIDTTTPEGARQAVRDLVERLTQEARHA